jgi:hypothetical protein
MEKCQFDAISLMKDYPREVQLTTK